MICILTINSRTKRHEININGDGTKTNREIKKNNDWRTQLPTERKRTIKDIQVVGSMTKRIGKESKERKKKMKDETERERVV